MAWKATVEEASALALEGEHRARLTNIQDMDGQHGPMVRIEFTLSPDDESEGRVWAICNKKLTDSTKLGRWVAAVLGRTPSVGEKITTSDLLNKECRVIVKHKTNPDGQVFANVVDVLSLGGEQGQLEI
jgi:hypothetical protein